jgi:D-lactate dehydrogenase
VIVGGPQPVLLNQAAAPHAHETHYFEARLTADTAPLAAGFPAVCGFVNDQLDTAALQVLAAGSTRLVALRRIQQR